MSDLSPSTSKTLRFVEDRAVGEYSIFINGELWYLSSSPPGWFFWVGMMQQYGRYEIEVIHDVIE